MDPYILLLAGFGALVLLTAWLPLVLKELPLSLPIVCVVIGAVLFAFPETPGVAPDPRQHAKLTERLTELVVIISLMGAGLKIDRVFGWRAWVVTWRLLGVAMPLTIALLALLAHWLLGLGAAAALLLAAALAPTDPVLASDIEVGPPGSGEEDEVRFALTSEAGLNDALAFPFVLAAVALAVASQTGEPWFWAWFSKAVLWKLTAGAAIGWALGRALGWIVFHVPNRAKLSRTGDGFVALGITCLAYAVTEMAGGYGFLAVFITAIGLRNAERYSRYHEKLHDFAEQLERLLMMVLLVLFGGALVSGNLLAGWRWEVGLFALLALFLVRPLSGWIGLVGTGMPGDERGIISFFGIRGMGSFYYLSYGLTHGPFENPDLLWSTMSVIVLVSILLHGITVTPIMSCLDRRRNGKAPALVSSPVITRSPS
jgi:NhaP-type Na+/H+ or K+/H+ antiporter